MRLPRPGLVQRLHGYCPPHQQQQSPAAVPPASHQPRLTPSRTQTTPSSYCAICQQIGCVLLQIRAESTGCPVPVRAGACGGEGWNFCGAGHAAALKSCADAHGAVLGLYGFWPIHVLTALAQLEVPEALASGPAAAGELAQRLGLDEFQL